MEATDSRNTCCSFGFCACIHYFFGVLFLGGRASLPSSLVRQRGGRKKRPQLESGNIETASLAAEWKGDGEATSMSELACSESQRCWVKRYRTERGMEGSLRWQAVHSGRSGFFRQGVCLETKKTKKELVSALPAKVLIQDGWSVLVVRTFEDFRVADRGVCPATRSEAEETIRGLRSGKGLPILTAKQVKDGPEEVEFEVKTVQSQSIVWKRYLVQLGTVAVTYKCSAARGGAVEADTVLAVIDFSKKHCHPDAWATALAGPKSATAHRLETLDVDLGDMFPHRFCGDERIEVVAMVQRESLEKVLRGSGEFNAFSRHLFVKGEPRVYRDIPLPDDFDLQAALRKAKSVGRPFMGVVLRGKGLGLRTKECDFESVVGPHGGGRQEVYRGKVGGYQSAPILEQCGCAGVLAGWSCKVEASFRAGEIAFGITRGATQASTSVGARNLHDPRQVYSRETRRKLLQFLYPSRVQRQRNALSQMASRWTRQNSVASLLLWCRTAARRRHRFCSLHDRNGWMPCSLRPPQCWPILPRSSRCSRRRCSRSRLLSDSSGPDAVPPAQVTEMKIAEKQDDEFKEHDGLFPLQSLKRWVAIADALGKPKVQISQTCIILSHPTAGAGGGHSRLGGFGDDLVVRVRGRSCPAACRAIEISPCPSPCRGGKARGQDEDEMAPPQKIPQSCSQHCGAGVRRLAPWSTLHDALSLPALLYLAVSQCFSAETYPALPPRVSAAASHLCPERGWYPSTRRKPFSRQGTTEAYISLPNSRRLPSVCCSLLVEPHFSCTVTFGPKPARPHQRPWSAGRAGLPRDVVASCARPAHESRRPIARTCPGLSIEFGPSVCWRNSEARKFTLQWSLWRYLLCSNVLHRWSWMASALTRCSSKTLFSRAPCLALSGTSSTRMPGTQSTRQASWKSPTQTI